MTVRLAPLPPTDAIAALEARGRYLAPSWSWQDRWGEEHAEAFTVARSAGFDVLKDLFDGLSSALKEGKTGRDFAREMMPVLFQKGWWGRKEVDNPDTGEPEEVQLGSPRRLQLIFDSNMRVSHAAGHWSAFERNKADRPYLRYVALKDGHTRPQHARWHNTVLPVDHPWWDTHATPCGWRCRCTLQSLSARDIDRLRAEGEVLSLEAPAIEWESFERRDGTVIEVPVGIDPGWAHNPGKRRDRAAQMNTAQALKVAALPPPIAIRAASDIVDSDEFARWFADPQGDMPIMSIPPVLVERWGLETSTALLSEDTMRKQRANHPELTLDDYRAIPSAATEPDAILEEEGSRALIFKTVSESKYRLVVLKATKTKRGAFVTSYRWSDPQDVLRLLRRAKVILGAIDESGRVVGPPSFNPT